MAAKTYLDDTCAWSAVGSSVDDNAFLAAHPVGDYWWTSSSIDPNTEYGGTWEKVTDKFIYASGSKSVGDTGGSETVTLTVDQIPSHSHGVPAYRDDGTSKNRLSKLGSGVSSVSSDATGGSVTRQHAPVRGCELLAPYCINQIISSLIMEVIQL